MSFLFASKKSSGPKKVAYVHDSPGFGGIEVLVARQLSYLDKSRYNPLVIIPSYYDQPTLTPFLEDLRSRKIPIFKTFASARIGFWRFAQDVLQMAQLFRKNKIDLVQIHTRASYQGRKATLAARLARVPALVRTEHSSPSISISPVTKYKIKFFDFMTDYIVTVSEADRQEQISLLDRDARKLFCCYNGIELNKFNSAADTKLAKRRLGLDPDVPVIGLVGRLAEQKGHKYLVEALPRIIEEYGKVNVLFVGTGELEGELQAQIASLNLAENVHFAGFQSDPQAYIEAMDIATFPSLYEAFPLVMLEYMALAKPIIMTDIPCAHELIEDGASGLVIPAKDSGALSDSILKLLHNPALAATLGQGAFESVKSEFTIERNAENTMKLYDSLLV